MTSPMIDAIAAHRAAWQAFQDAPADENCEETIVAADIETEALATLLRAVPQDRTDLLALKVHLDWWVREEAQRQYHEPEPFMLHAVITLSAVEGADRARREIQARAQGHMSAAALYPDGITKDAHLERGAEAFACADAIRGIGQ